MYIIIHAHCKIVLAICWDASRQSVVCGKTVFWVYFAVGTSNKSLVFNATNLFIFFDEIWHFWNLNMVCWLNIKT